jgi:hypothetical protein
MSFRNPNSFTRFADLVTSGAKEPARNNLYSVDISMPAMLFATGKNPDYKEHFESINYFADNVTLPARRIKTESVKDIGMPRDFAYGQQKQEVRFSFIMTKDMYHRAFFETWMNMTTNDAENRVTFYDEYTANIQILKWELGSNVVLQKEGKKGNVKYRARLNQSTAVWQMYGAYPFDISAMTLNNGPADLLKIDVDFKYERFRFDTVSVGSFKKNAKDKIIGNLNKFDQLIKKSQVDAQFYGI